MIPDGSLEVEFVAGSLPAVGFLLLFVSDRYFTKTSCSKYKFNSDFEGNREGSSFVHFNLQYSSYS